MNIKKIVAAIFAKFVLPLTYIEQDSFDHLCRNVTKFNSNKITQDELLKLLQLYYSRINTEKLKTDLNFTDIKNSLIQTNGYKHTINDKKEPGIYNKLSLYSRKFAIMRHLGMKVDVIILRKNEYIPPHGHKRMLSGFYVLEGTIGVRHYDLVDKNDKTMLIRKTLDTMYSKNEYTTNSDNLDNIHWLKGIASESFLYRVSIIDKQREEGNDNMGAEERIYINPTITPDNNGLIHAPYINEDLAKTLTFPNAA